MAQQNFKDATNTYSGFISMVKWGTIMVAAVTIFVVMIIS